ALLDLRAAEAPRFSQARGRSGAPRARRRGRGRARGRRVVSAVDARYPRRGAGRSPARRDPALPHVLRGGPVGTPGAAPVNVNRILVGTDRSETATRAVRWARDMAQRYEAELIILQAGGAKDELESYVAEHAPGSRYRVDSVEQDPAASIIAAAEAEDVDVIIVGNVGMGG